MLSRLHAALYRFYFLTWVCFLILRKRAVPKWMREDARKLIETSLALGKIEKVVR